MRFVLVSFFVHTVAFAAPPDGAPTVLPQKTIAVDRSGLATDKLRATTVVEGLKFENLTPDSPMAMMGFQNGDVLASVNGRPMTIAGDLALLQKSVKLAKFHDYEVLRGGQKLKWKLEFMDRAPAANAPTAAPPKPTTVVEGKPERTIKLKKAKVEELTKNLSEVLMQARMVPDMDKKTGEVRCFRAVDVQPKSIFKMAGLQPGDCVVSVNGQLMNSPAASMEVYTQVQTSGGPVTYTVERRGEKKTIRVEVE